MKYKIRRSAAGLHVQAAPTDKIGFYGAAPVAQRASANQAVATDPGSTETLVNELRTALVNLGLIKGGAMIAFLLGLTMLMLGTVPAQAYTDTQNLGVTNNIAASTTQTAGLGNAIDVSNHAQVTVYLYFQSVGADNTGAITLLFARSSTGATYETAPLLTLTAKANGTNQVVYTTNFTSSVFGSASWVKLVSFQNAATNGLTNVVVEVNRQHIY